MTHVGVLCNVDVDGDPREQLSASVVNRTFMIGRLLAGDGIRLFLFCPKDVAETGEVRGFVLEDERLVPSVERVPHVNANWSYRTRQLLRQGMGYQPFKQWMHDRRKHVFVPYDFSELVSNKLKAYEEVCGWDEALHPHTEEFLGSSAQIEEFHARSRTVFVKPRAGHKGNRIFVLRRQGSGCALEYYDSHSRRSFPRLSMIAVLGLLEAAATRERYVIQSGIESLRHQDRVFDVRVVMAHDGRDWHGLLESRLAPPGSDLSNVYQGGTIRVTRDLLTATVGECEGHAIEDRVRKLSRRLAERFESRFPGSLPEIGFDFVLDVDREPHLVEVNAKPGIAGTGSERKCFDWTSEERWLHEQWTIPHMMFLAGFLRHRVGLA